jgi:hypothetical protein
MTTGIGSLPHHNADTALEYAFRFGMPFLPQIPIRNPWEYMIAQALEGLPGLQAQSDGSATLNTDVWLSRAADFSQRLEKALASYARDPQSGAIQAFEPGASISSCWQPFVWELGERGVKRAKIQIAGPMTAQWALKLRDNAGHDVPAQPWASRNPELSGQVFRLVLARALAMSLRLRSQGVEPWLSLDEPGLYGLSMSNPRHVMAMQELKVLVQALVKEGVHVGIHCCSNTDWSAVLSLPIHFLSFDVSLSLESLVERRSALASFLERGGRLALGVVPTPSQASERPTIAPTALRNELVRALGEETASRALANALYTPACGLAFHTVAESERILEALSRFERECRGTPDGARA